MQVKCLTCGKIIKTFPSQVLLGKGKHCSLKCRWGSEDKEELFWAFVNKRGPDECWPWTGAINKRDGRGVFRWYGRKMIPASRAAYIFRNGKIPKEIFVCHSCDNPPCCNPNHLFPGTQHDNMQDCAIKKRIKHVLTKELAKKIYESRHYFTARQVSEYFGVSEGCVQHIYKKRVWKHIHGTT